MNQKTIKNQGEFVIDLDKFESVAKEIQKYRRQEQEALINLDYLEEELQRLAKVVQVVGEQIENEKATD